MARRIQEESVMIDYKRIALFAGGVLFGTAGIKVLTSKDAKKVYSQTTAAVLRMKDCVMNTVTNVQEEAGDIYATAQEINEKRAVADAEQVVEDTAAEAAETVASDAEEA